MGENRAINEGARPCHSRGALSKPRPMASLPAPSPAIRRVVAVVAIANLAYFFVEFAVARRIGSVSLFADSVDFLEDASVNLLILLGMGWSASARARLAFGLAILLIAPATAGLLTAWSKFGDPVAPPARTLMLTGIGALVVNLGCALLLARVRHHGGSLTRAAFLSAQNDAAANIAIIGAALITLWSPSPWPDLIVGVGIAMLNLDAAREIMQSARRELVTA